MIRDASMSNGPGRTILAKTQQVDLGRRGLGCIQHSGASRPKSKMNLVNLGRRVFGRGGQIEGQHFRSGVRLMNQAGAG